MRTANTELSQASVSSRSAPLVRRLVRRSLLDEGGCATCGAFRAMLSAILCAMRSPSSAMRHLWRVSRHALCAMRSALCAMRSALFRHAPCAMRSALFRHAPCAMRFAILCAMLLFLPTLAPAQGIFDTVTASNAVRQTSASGTNYFMGNVGIGISVPTSKLHVQGGGLRQSAEGVVFSETATDNMGFESASYPVTGQTNSVWMGYGALYASTGRYNSAIGMGALRGSIGQQNNAQGYYALRDSPGSYNNAAGQSALRDSPGSYNNAQGIYALRDSPGSYNSAQGSYALYQAPGSYNIGAGYNSGYRTGGTSNVFVGANCAYATSSKNYTNAIAIGAGAVTLGNNSMVLGNAGTTKTAIKGNVGIGTSTPTELLHVNGKARFDGGVAYLAPLGDLAMGSFTNSP